MQRARPGGQGQTLPPQPTTFVGRKKEIADATRLLTDPACRLLTLYGPGGSGKTRLALKVAGDILETFAGEVYFVPLQPITDSEFLVSAIADTLGLSLSGHEAPTLQLLAYLRERELLLVLDNFEHLLPGGGTDLLLDILHTAPAVKCLVTSREVLHLQEEWLYPIEGMPVPESEAAEKFDSYDAVQFFIACARRVRPNFSPVEEQAGIVRICRLVEGMPLAIELAASWRRALRCSVIADEIQRSIEFLETNLRNVPDRHRSMQAIFDQSWKLLAREERAVFTRLSIFRGGFTREAAEAVAGASLPVLSTMVDKSLLRCEPDGRYQIHELLRQYAQERLHASPDEAERTGDAHCTYYMQTLGDRFDALRGRRQREAILELQDNLENLRVAWRWAIDHTKLDDIEKGAHALALFYHYQSRYREGADALQIAIARLERQPAGEQRDRILAIVLVQQGWLYVRLGHFDESVAMVERSSELHTGLGSFAPGPSTDPLTPLGVIATIRGDYVEAARLGEEVRRRAEAQGHTDNLRMAYYILTRAATARGRFQSARYYAQRAYALTEALEDQWFMAYCRNELGNVARAQGNYGEARQHYQASYRLREALNDPEGMAVALNHLGKVAILQEAYEEAGQLYEESLMLYRDIADRGGLATALEGSAIVACERGDVERARQHLLEALQIAADIHFVPLILSLLVAAADLLLRTGETERGVELLQVALHDSTGDHETVQRAQQLLSRHGARPLPEPAPDAGSEGRLDDLETIATNLRRELLLQTEPLADAGTSGDSRPEQTGHQALVDPLTPRELEVLRMIADGRSNQEIAEALIISIGTVKSHTHRIYGKLGAQNRVEAVTRAAALDLL